MKTKDIYVDKCPLKWVKSVAFYPTTPGFSGGLRRGWQWNLIWWRDAYRRRL